MNKDRISVNWCRNKGLQGRRGENRGEGECVWRMGLGARPERISKASRRNGRTRQTLWGGCADANPKTCCQTIYDCQKVVPLHYESE